jgi:hypothetical protein
MKTKSFETFLTLLVDAEKFTKKAGTIPRLLPQTQEQKIFLF